MYGMIWCVKYFIGIQKSIAEYRYISTELDALLAFHLTLANSILHVGTSLSMKLCLDRKFQVQRCSWLNP